MGDLGEILFPLHLKDIAILQLKSSECFYGVLVRELSKW